MNQACVRLARCGLALAAVIVLQPVAFAAGWFDDFNDMNVTDGNPVTWTYNEAGYTPGTHTAATGDFALSAPGEVSVIGVEFDNDSLVPSVNMSFTDVYVRTQAIVLPGPAPEEVGGNVGVVARWDPATLSGYAGFLDDGDQFELIRIDGGAPITLDSMRGIGLDALTDVIVELDIVGTELRLYAWRPGDPKPETPLTTFVDDTYASGRAGLLFNEDNDNTTGVFRFAAAQDTPFVETAPADFDGNGIIDGADFLKWQKDLGDDASLTTWKNALPPASAAAVGAIPEPASASLLGAAALGLAALARKRRQG
jgi:hypothetical protein